NKKVDKAKKMRAAVSLVEAEIKAKNSQYKKPDASIYVRLFPLFFYFCNNFRCNLMIFFSQRMILLVNRRCKNILFLIWLLQRQLAEHLCMKNLSKLLTTTTAKYVFFLTRFFTFKIGH